MLEGDNIAAAILACEAWQKTLHTAQPAIAGSSQCSAEPVFSVAVLFGIFVSTAFV